MNVVASVWVGRSSSDEALDAALVSASSCDGDGLGSAFSRGVGQPALGDAVRERRRIAQPTTVVRELIDGLSFASRLTSARPEVLPVAADTIVVFFGVPPLPGRFESSDVTLEALLPTA